MSIPMDKYKNEDALVLFSGGQDSTTCLFWAKKNFKNVHTICFSYGQRHSHEIEIARRIAEMAHVSFQVLDIGVISHLVPNSLIDSSIEIDTETPADSLPNTFVPGRNMLFLTYAAAIAYEKNIPNLVTGVSETDYSGYPDCRNDFIRSFNTSLNLAMEKQFVIHTPLMWRNKKQVWQLADELGVFELVRDETLTCYNDIKSTGCGNCPACKLRNRGMEEYLLSKK